MEVLVLTIAIQKLGDFVAETLRNYATGQHDILTKVKSNVAWLRTELGYMLAFLKDAEQENEVGHRLQHWISDVHDIANETVSVLQELTMERAPTKGCLEVVQLCAWERRSKSIDIFDINEQIESLKARVEQISRRRETYDIPNINADKEELNQLVMAKEMRRTTSYVDAQQLLVGFEDVKLQLLNKLLENEPRRSVVSIYGMGGLGKTTLARSIYNSKQVIGGFRIRAWICVSQEYNIQDILRSVIKSLQRNYKQLMLLEKMDVSKMDVGELERHLRQLLNDSRYLVVVDDVWEKVAWETLKTVFPDTGKGSRVIVTTRNKNLAKRLDERVYAHKLRFLNPKESWDLFNGKLSCGHQQCSPHMRDLGEKMVAKCRGLPLAVVVLGGLLAHKRDLIEWQEVKKHIWRHLADDSIEISNLLSLSYYHLPRELKICFLYFGTFPEDYLIDADELTYLWMAEQFIPSGEEMEEVAEHCLNQLINRGLIHVEEKMLGKNFKCRIHDLLRDLAIQKAFRINLFDIYNPDRELSALVHKQRHVVHTQIQRYLSVDYSNRKLQSIVILNHDREDHAVPQLFAILKIYEQLCVLKLERVELPDELPDVIGRLEQLKFLGLLDTCTVVLPPSIGNLRNLQTLEALPLDRTDCVLPPEISKLTNLRHLICRVSGNPELGSLSNLRTLKNIKYEHWLTIENENLFNLRELVIEDIHKSGRPLGPFTIFSRLRTLVLICRYEHNFPPLDFLSSCQNLQKLWLEGRVEELPPFPMWPKSLTTLKLALSELPRDSSSTLGRLPNLRRLDLYESHKIRTMVFDSTSYPQLEILNLRDLHCLSELRLEDGAMPKIKRLHVSECQYLKEIPMKLKSILLPSENERDYFDSVVYFGARKNAT